MSRANFTRSLCSVFAAVTHAAVLLACAGDTGGIPELANVACDQANSCGCFTRVYGADVDTCKVEYGADIDYRISMGTAAGLIYDDDCMRSYVAEARRSGCSTTMGENLRSIWNGSDCGSCRVLHGEVAIGGTCNDYDDDCAQGLYCRKGTCADPCATADAGQDCALASCADGLYCDTSATCKPRLPQGEDCFGHDECAEHLICRDPEGTCEPLPRIGEPCPEGFCVDEAYCESDRTCHERKGEGGACSRDMCREELECRYERHDGTDWQWMGTCSAPSPLICGIVW